jgi:MFS family permease
MQTPWRKLYVLSIAAAISWLGSGLTSFAVILRDKDVIGPTGVSLYLLAFGAPSILLAPLSGWLADRFSSRQVLLPSVFVMGLGSLSLAANLPIWWTPLALLLTASAGTIVGAAWQAAEVSVTAPEDVPQVTGLMQSTAAMGMLFAPALGGILVSTAGYFWPFVIDAVSFWILGLVFLSVGINRKYTPHEAGEKVKALDGIKFVFGDRLIRSLVILVAVLVVALGSFNVGEVFLVKDELHASDLIYGIVGAVFAGGSILGSVLTAAIKVPVNKHAFATVLGMTTISLAILAMSFVGHWWMIMPLALITGLGNAVLNNYAISIVMTRSPSEALGRVNAAIGAVVQTGSVLGIVISGIAIAALNVRPVLLIGGALSLGILAILAPEVLRAGKTHKTSNSVSDAS